MKLIQSEWKTNNSEAISDTFVVFTHFDIQSFPTYLYIRGKKRTSQGADMPHLASLSPISISGT